MSWIGDKAEATANVLKDLLTQTPAAKLYRQGLPNVLDALLNTREEEWRAKVQAMPKPFDSSPEAINRDMEAAMAFWNPAGMLGKIVYHGSPHKFDKFDASKIGTGEGAQAYGHGVYLADAEDVAKEYAAANAGRAAAKSGFLDSLPPGAQVDVMKIMDQKHRGPLARAQLERVKDRLSTEQYEAVVREFDAGGALYKADLPDEWIPKMLDWDKPLSQQKDAAAALDALQASPELPNGFGAAIAAARTRPHFDGNDLYRELVKVLPNDQVATVMNRAGFPGIRYLDGGSRGKGQGSYNYVVFPGLEDKVKILERNGQPVNALAEILK